METLRIPDVVPEPTLGSARVIVCKQKDRKKPTLGFCAVLKTS